MQQTKIEWLKNPDGMTAGYSCNPVKGICNDICEYCYAKKLYKRFKWNPEVRFDYSALDGLEKLKAGSKVFMGSTHDLFGDWISDEWIESIMIYPIQNPKLTFIYLTKNPKRYNTYDFPKNAWLGYSTTGNLFHKWDERHSDNVKFVSLEPMAEPIHASLEGYAQRIDFQWLIIGQESGNRKGKHIVNSDELQSTVEFARKAGMKIFVKDNLKSHFDEKWMIETLKFLPQEFPETIGREQ